MDAPLDQEEKSLLASYENDEWESVPDKEAKMELLRTAAHNTLSRNKSINIRISEREPLPNPHHVGSA